MEESYAQALWRMVEEGMAPKKATDALYQSLVVRGRESLMPKILHAFKRLAARERIGKGATLSVAKEKDLRKAHKGAKEALSGMEMHLSDIEEKVDESLIGGWRFEGSGMLVDASFKKQLVTLYNRATKD